MVKNKISIVAFSAVLALVSICLWGCSDDFLEEKKDYNRHTPEIYNDYTGAKLRVDDVYLRLLPQANSGVLYNSPGGGGSDDQTKATEEYTGFSFYVDPERALTAEPGADWYNVSGDKATTKTPWGAIRNCNDVIDGISKGTLPEEQKNELLGQMYFFRAWQYYLLVQTYGGVPLIKELQTADANLAKDLLVPRATTKECIDFICAEMQKAASMLPGSWSGEYGRITRGAALAVAGRARLLYASPLFNRGDSEERWELAYNANKAALDTLMMDGVGLYPKEGENGAGFAKMFSEFQPKEGVFFTMYNKVHDDNMARELWRNNTREQGLRPYNTGGSGTDVTANMVDLFPMADGKKPTEAGVFTYDKLVFFRNRDPRFYRTFAFPGVRWRQGHGNPSSLSDASPERFVTPNGNDYVLWNYTWYPNAADRDNPELMGYGADLLAKNVKGVFLRKRSQDFDVATPHASLVRWPLSMGEQRSGNNLFREGAFPHMEIRYAEVMLNFAEAACGMGRMDEAIQVLRTLRERAGYDAAYAPEYGITATTRAEVFAAILYERQIEFAYEGKRFNDMRRWMLWDGGVTQPEGAPGSWTLSGEFAGGTCAYLGVQPLNGSRRDKLVLHAKDDSPEGVAEANDRLKSLRPTPLDVRESFASQGGVIDALASFYTSNLVRKTVIGDKRDLTVKFLPKNYFLGLNRSAQQNNLHLLQTIGWPDYNKGSANGTYDPLAE